MRPWRQIYYVHQVFLCVFQRDIKGTAEPEEDEDKSMACKEKEGCMQCIKSYFKKYVFNFFSSFIPFITDGDQISMRHLYVQQQRRLFLYQKVFLMPFLILHTSRRTCIEKMIYYLNGLLLGTKEN